MPLLSRRVICFVLACAITAGQALKLQQSQRKEDSIVVDFYFAPICGYCHKWVVDSLNALWKDPEFKPYLGTLVVLEPHAIFFEGESSEEAQKSLTLAMNCANKHLERTQVIDVVTCVEQELTHKGSVTNMVNTCITGPFENADMESCMSDPSVSLDFQREIFKNAPGTLAEDGSFRVPFFSIAGEQKVEIQTDFTGFLCEQIVQAGNAAPSACGAQASEAGDEVVVSDTKQERSGASACSSDSPCFISMGLHESHKVPAWVYEK